MPHPTARKSAKKQNSPVRPIRIRSRNILGASSVRLGRIQEAAKLLLGESKSGRRDTRKAAAIELVEGNFLRADNATRTHLRDLRTSSRKPSPELVAEGMASYDSALNRVNARRRVEGKKPLSVTRKSAFIKLAYTESTPHTRTSSMRTQARTIAEYLHKGYLANERSDRLINRILKEYPYFFEKGGKTFLEERLRAEEKRFAAIGDTRYAQNYGKLLKKISALEKPAHAPSSKKKH